MTHEPLKMGRPPWYAAAIAGLLLLAGTAHGRDALPMRFDRLSMDDGLSQTTVNAIHQDATGFMWFGTENGLNRFDGYKFEHYRRQRGNPSALSNDFIWDVAQDSSGNLWIATDGGGLALWDATADLFRTYRNDPADPASLASNWVRALLIDEKGAVWVATRSGLDRLDPDAGTFEHFRHDPDDPHSLADDGVYTLHLDTRGDLWVGTDNGLSRLDRESNTFTTYRHDPDDASSLGDNRIRVLYQDRAGFLWAGTRRGGLNRFDAVNGAFRRYQHDPADPASLGHDTVRAILEDAEGRLWVGTGGGLDLFDRRSETFTHYRNDRTNPDSLSDNYVMSLFQDAAGNLWVGTRSAGINKWNPRSWGFGHFAPERLSDGNVTAFAEGPGSALWVGTFGGGVNRIDRKTGEITAITHEADRADGLSGARIMSLLLDSRGDLWLGTMNAGLNRMDPATGKITQLRNLAGDLYSLSANGVMALHEDRAGDVWIGTFGGGINRYNHQTGRIERFAYETGDATGLSGSRATSITQDQTGRIWVGTDGAGLNLLDPTTGVFHHFRHDPLDARSLSADTVYDLHVDSKGTVWVGTRGGGLDRIVGSSAEPRSITFKNYSQAEHGLTNDVIYGIESDLNGRLWLSTNYGLTQLNPDSGELKNFHRSHGLQAEEFNFGAHYRGEHGELFFGGANGFNAFLPEDLSVNDRPPAIALIGLGLSGQASPSDDPTWRRRNVNLDYKTDAVSFEFSALDFTAPQENTYAYRLEGFDAEWVDAGTRRLARYTNLDAGDYTFHIRAANSDGVWNETLAIGLTVEPPPWETWWAYLGYVAFVLLALGTFWRSQHNKLQREAEFSRRLEVDVHSRTRELAESNEHLKSLNQRLLEASFTDHLTGLRNRRYVFEHMAKDLDALRHRNAEARIGAVDQAPVNLAFMMVDLDHLKPINDTYGHAAGDRILIQVKELLLRNCPDTASVVRWGGDEFLVIARYADHAEVEALAEHIRSRMASTVFSVGDGQVARTTCSVGFTCSPFADSHPDLLGWEQLISLADAAMYRAKHYRNSWLTFVSTETTHELEDPFYAIRDHAEDAAERGMLEIRCSRHFELDDAVGTFK